MKPDAYLPFYGDKFFQAVEGKSDQVVVAYMRVLWYYWAHNHCEGLPDDQDELRRICRCYGPEWDDIQPIIFGQYFELELGLWQQERAKHEHERAASNYASKVRAARLSHMARTRNKRRDE